METADIITLIGIIITAVLAGANLVTAFFNQRQSQGYNLRMADYERRYVQLTDNVSQYISMLDAHWLSFMALNEEEYEGKDAEIYERYHQMETAHYKIKLLLSNENHFFQEFCTILDDSLAVADKVMLTNPKYKGWYCGNKTQTLDYRTKKKAFLEESEWVMYPDPNIPAIVSEELWDRANAIFKQRSREVRTKSTSYHNRYAYSGKIVCGIHGTSLQRQSFKTQKGVREFWRCKMYRQKGKDACSLPSVRSDEVDLVLADLFQKVVTEKAQIIRLVLNSIGETDNSVDYSAQIGRIEVQIGQIEEKKDKLLELSMADAITLSEFKVRNDRFNRQISALEEQKATLQQQEQVQKGTEIDAEALEKALWEELDFTNGIHSEVVATILDHIVVLEQSNDKQIHLEIYLRLGQRASVHFQRGELVLCNSPSSQCVRPGAGCAPPACFWPLNLPVHISLGTPVPPPLSAAAEKSRFLPTAAM